VPSKFAYFYPHTFLYIDQYTVSR